MDSATGTVISSRARLARNIEACPFPEWAGDEERVRLRDELRDVFGKVSSLKDPVFLDLDDMDAVDREVLKERHLISNELAERTKGSSLVIAENERVGIMINEEDHLRLQAMMPGLALKEVWEKIDAADTDLESHVRYAFSSDLGYLTACPTNVGTGLRASVMLHLPGLRLMDEVDGVAKGLNAIGFEVRGLLGEGTAAYGNMFQVSNRATLGEKETDIVEQLVGITREVVGHERNARARLVRQERERLLDHVGRAYGIMLYARVLSSQEALDLLSSIRLGMEFELLDGVSDTRINEVMLLTQPGHLQKMAGETLEPGKRDEIRAHRVREMLAGVAIKG